MIDQATRPAETRESAAVLNFTRATRPVARDVAAFEEVAASRPARRLPSQVDRLCNWTILAIIALPFLLGIGALVRRLIGN